MINKAYDEIEFFYSKHENREFDYSQCKLKLNALLVYDNIIKSDFYTNQLEPKFKLKIVNYIKSLKESNNIIEDSSLVDGDFENELLFYESYYNEKPQLNESNNSDDEHYHSSFLRSINNDIFLENSYIRIEKILNQYLLQNGKIPNYQLNPKKQPKNKIFQIEKDYSKNNNTSFVNQNFINKLKDNKLVGLKTSKLTIMNSFNFIEFKRERLDKIIYREFMSFLHNYEIEHDDFVETLILNKNKFPFVINGKEFKSINTSFLVFIFSSDYLASLFESYISNHMNQISSKIKSKFNKDVSSAYNDQLKFYLMNYAKIYSNKLG